MDKRAHLLIGGALVAAGAVLLVGFRDSEFLWFTGQPLGVVLVILGALDLFDYARKRRRDPSES